MSKLESLLQDGLRSELMLKQQLKALGEALRKQLQDTQRKQTEELERRIHLNAQLSNNGANGASDVNQQIKEDGLRRSTIKHHVTLTHHRLPEKPKSSPPTLVSTRNWENVSSKPSEHTPSQLRKEREAEAECQNKFCALPVPSHVTQPLYQELMELREKERKQGHEQRRDFLLMIQKPFSFQEREKEKKEKIKATLNQITVDQIKKVSPVKKPSNKEPKDMTHSEQKDLDTSKQIAPSTSICQKNPAVSGSSKLRTADRTRKEKLGFLDEKPSFHPKINHQVPDFSRLHRALQTEGLKQTQCRDGIKCQPFSLRTSVRGSKISPESSQIIINRKSMELREKKTQESVDWLKQYQMRSQAMKKTVSLHAKLLDPHSILKEVSDERVQKLRQADRQRMRDYMRELQDMKARVSERPYLFEQVTQKKAKAQAEQAYKDKLKKVGLKEQFVKEKGETAWSRSWEDTDEKDIHSRDENVEDGKKIEDVDEKSVKSKEEMP